MLSRLAKTSRSRHLVAQRSNLTKYTAHSASGRDHIQALTADFLADSLDSLSCGITASLAWLHHAYTVLRACGLATESSHLERQQHEDNAEHNGINGD